MLLKSPIFIIVIIVPWISLFKYFSLSVNNVNFLGLGPSSDKVMKICRYLFSSIFIMIFSSTVVKVREKF